MKPGDLDLNDLDHFDHGIPTEYFRVLREHSPVHWQDETDGPGYFDITRDPNPHVSFGIGEHFCLGANFARMQLHSIFREILTRLPDIQSAGPVKRLRGNFVDGIREMPVTFTPES